MNHSFTHNSFNELNNNYSKGRRINKNPVKVLDAPALSDDFYLNLIDWSSQNQLAVGLGNCIYLWNAETSKVTKLC
jgi:cell division cycle 20-like protein 1 (cofactor of APC complex)